MDKYRVINDIKKSIQDLDEVEKNSTMIDLCRIQKEIEEIEKMQIEQVRTKIIQSANMYGIRKEIYEEQINDIVKKYKKSIEEVRNIYNCFYLNIVKMKQEAINNQKIAIANIITIINRIEKDNSNYETNQETIKLCAKKKLDYGVIIDECDERIEWSIKEIELCKESIKLTNENKMLIVKENIFSKIRKKIINILKGKTEFKNFLMQYERDTITKFKEKNSNIVANITLTLAGIIKQIKKANQQIKTNSLG